MSGVRSHLSTVISFVILVLILGVLHSVKPRQKEGEQPVVDSVLPLRSFFFSGLLSVARGSVPVLNFVFVPSETH